MGRLDGKSIADETAINGEMGGWGRCATGGRDRCPSATATASVCVQIMASLLRPARKINKNRRI